MRSQLRLPRVRGVADDGPPHRVVALKASGVGVLAVLDHPLEQLEEHGRQGRLRVHRVEERLAAAQKEIDERAARNKPVNEMCPVATDKAVDPAQFVDHDGRRIAFCCAKCKAAFQKDPAKYLANLPAKK